MPLEGRTVALAEGRQLEDLARMLENEGAHTLRCPMLSIFDHPNTDAVDAWIARLIAHEFTHVVLLTGEGLRRLLGFADRSGRRSELIAALSAVRIITRGPKPVQALKEIGLKPTKVASAPTTDGVIATLKEEALEGAKVGVQLYCDTNLPLTSYLESANAQAFPVAPYVYAPAADSDRVAQMIQEMADGRVDVLVFTSSPQVDRVYEVADEKKMCQQLRQGLQRVKVAAVGPVVKERLLERDARVDIMPEQGFQMKNLVQHIKRALS
jgi:uroporphyrinogen-III synthase